MPKKESEFLTEEEASAILRCPDRRTEQGRRDYAILLLMLSTGLRKAEVCSLRVSNISIYRSYKVLDIVGKGGKHRRIPLRKEVLFALGEYWRSAELGGATADPFFLTLGSGPYPKRPLTPTAIEELVVKYARMAAIGKRISPHSLRHTFATNLLQKGVDLKTVQILLGHSSPSTTLIYLHSNDERKLDAINRIGFSR